jgi:hypothetical protein
MVLNEDNLEDAKSFVEFFDTFHPQNGIAIGLCYEPGKCIDTEKAAKFLCELYDLIKDSKTEHYILLFKEIERGLKNKPPKYCKIGYNSCMAFITFDAIGNMYSGCQRKDDMLIGHVSKMKSTSIIQKHLENIRSHNDRIQKPSLYEMLGQDKRFAYFQTTGCPNRLDEENRDPYLRVYTKLTKHISESSALSLQNCI